MKAAIFNSPNLVSAILHSKLDWWWPFSLNLMMAAILISSILDSASAICGIQTPCFLLSDSLKHTLPLLWLWLKLIHSDSKSFIVTQLDYVSHLEFCHLGFRHYHLGLSHLSYHLSGLTHTCQDWFLYSDSELKQFQPDSNLFIHTELDDDGHLEFCHHGFSFWHFGFRHLVFFSQIHSKLLSVHSDSDSN